LELSYEALGLLTSIPLSSNLNPLPAKASTKQLSENLISGYGRIVRDEDGNVVDVILPEDEEGASKSNEAEEDSDMEEEQRTVQGKTEVVKSVSPLISSLPQFPVT
jgi:nucleolar protein 16